MLLYFKCDNFKSFSDGFTFNMEPEKRMTELDYSIQTEVAGKKDVQALSASVIYGPNAAGKTSVVNAMSCMRQIVLRGNIKNADEDRTRDHVSYNMSLAPFAYQDEVRPVSFEVAFTHHGVVF